MLLCKSSMVPEKKTRRQQSVPLKDKELFSVSALAKFDTQRQFAIGIMDVTSKSIARPPWQ
jgi:hypothetical protein